jgi:ABC-type Fe3+/spermidine/putrescine transport system ATPase subunit
MLDEPLGALDAGLRARLRTDLRAILKAEGLSALYVTHDQEEAFAVADRVGVLFAGRLAALLSPRDLYFSPPSAQVADFLGLGNQVPILALEPAGVGWQVQTVLGAFFITEKTEHLFLHPNSLHLSALEGTQAHIHYQPIGDKAPRWLAEAPPTWCFECIGQEFRGESTRLRLRHESGLRLQAVTLGLT